MFPGLSFRSHCAAGGISVNYIITGVGGQGTVLASKLIADTLMERGEKVRSAETIGMAQRGGSVVSHIRTGPVLSPLVPKGSADVLIGFEPAEAARCLPYLKKNGVAVISVSPVKPVTSSLEDNYHLSGILNFLKNAPQKTLMVEGGELCVQAGSSKVLNVCLLGVAANSGCLGITLEEMQSTLKRRIPPKLLEINNKALQTGAGAPLV